MVVKALLDAGLSPIEIARQLGVTKSTVAFHMRRLELVPDERYARRYDWKVIRAAYDGGLSYRECRRRLVSPRTRGTTLCAAGRSFPDQM